MTKRIKITISRGITSDRWKLKYHTFKYFYFDDSEIGTHEGFIMDSLTNWIRV